MSFNIKNSFVSRSIVQDNEEQQIATEEKKEEVVQEKYDPRTLYERLQEQRTIKEEKFAEESRLSNQIKRMDEEEIAFYKTLSDEKEKLEYEQKIKEKLELEEFRQAVDTARSNPAPIPELTPVKAAVKPKAPVKSNKKSALKGALFIKKKKRDDDEEEEEEKPEQKKQKTTESPPKAADKNSSGSLSLLSAYGDASSSDSEDDS